MIQQLKNLSGQKLWLWTLLLVSYIVQGAILGSQGSMLAVLTYMPSLTVRILLGMSNIGHSTKAFFAIFLQFFYIKSYGKRKFSVIIGQLIIGFNCFLIYLYQPQTFALSCLMIVNGIFNAVADIGLDSWSATQFSGLTIASSCQSIGLELGILLGYQVLFKGTSLEFALRLGLDSPILTVPSFMLILGLFSFTFALLIHFTLHQKPEPLQDTNSLALALKEVRSLGSGRMYHVLSYLMLYNIGTYAYSAAKSMYIKELGITTDYLATASLYIYPLGLAIKLLLLSSIIFNHREQYIIPKANLVLVFLHLVNSQILLQGYLELSLLVDGLLISPLDCISFVGMVRLVVCNCTATGYVNLGLIITTAVSLINLMQIARRLMYTVLYEYLGLTGNVLAGVCLQVLYTFTLQPFLKSRVMPYDPLQEQQQTETSKIK